MIFNNIINSVKDNILGGTPWTFANTASYAFYDYNTGVTDAGSGKVSSWEDSLGNLPRTITQNTGTNRPDLTANGIYFDGANDHLFNNNPFMTNSTNGVIVLAVVSAPPRGASDEWWLCEGSSASTNPHLVMLAKDANASQGGLDTQQLRNDANSVVSAINLNTTADIAYDDSFNLIFKKLDKQNNIFSSRVNGVAGGTPQSFTPSGTYTLDRFSIGALVRSTVLQFTEFTLKGLAVIDAGVGTNDELRAEGYMAHKFGLSANLPADHPYKNSPPTI